MARPIKAHITGNIWRIEVKPGDHVKEGTVIAIIEAMKMEMPVPSDWEGVVEAVLVTENQAVTEGTVIATLADS